MRILRTLRVVALAWWCTGAATGCMGAPADASGTRSDTLFIGVAVPIPDQDLQIARPFDRYLQGVEIAVTHLNEKRVDTEDIFAIGFPPPTRGGADLAEPAVEIATAFRDEPRVIGVVGHPWSGQTIEAAPVYGDVEGAERRALAAVSPTATNPNVTASSPWVFRVCPTDRDGARALALYAADAAGIRRIAIIYRSDLFGRGFRRSFRAAFEAVGGEVVEEDPFVGGQTNLIPYLVRINRQDVDALVLAGIGFQTLDIVALLEELGMDLPILGSDGLSALFDDPVARSRASNVRYVTFYLAERGRSPENRRFRHDYEARFGIPPDHYAALSYDAAMLIGSAALEVGPDRRRIRDWIASRGRTAPAFPGATGPIQFNHQGDVIEKPVFVARLGR